MAEMKYHNLTAIILSAIFIVGCGNKAGNAIYFHDGEANNDPMYAQFNSMILGFYMVVVPVSSDFWSHDSNGTLVKETRTQLWCTERTSCYRELNMRFCPETELYYHLYQHASSGSPVPVSNELFAHISQDYPITENPEIREVYDNDGIEGVVAFCRDNGGFEKFMLEDFSIFCYIVTLLWDEGLYVQIDDESGTAYIACGRNSDWERIADLYLHK